MANKIYTNHTLEEYNKKYRNCKYRLLKFTKKEVEDFDKNNLTNMKGSLLKDRKWVLIKDTYYEIPKAPRYAWFRNLNGAVQASICLLGAGIVTTAITVPTVLAHNKGTTPYVEKYNKYLDLTDDVEIFGELDITSSNKEAIKKSMVVTVEDGEKVKNYTISFNKESIKDQIKVTSIAKVKIGNKELTESSEYTYALKEDGSIVITINNNVLEQYGTNVKITPRLGSNVVEEKDLKLSAKSLEMNAGDEKTISAERIGSCKDKVEFSIDDPGVIGKVSSTDNTITIVAKSSGSAKLTASWNGFERYCSITVKDATVHVQSINCNSDLIMNEQETVPFTRLGVTVTPSEATQTYSVQILEGDDVVEIDNTNKTIYSKKAGTAKLKIVSDDSSEKTSECEVTVKETIKNITKSNFEALLDTFIETQGALSGGVGGGASYDQNQITMSMTIDGEERDITDEIDNVDDDTVYFNETFAQEIGTDRFNLTAESHKDEILNAAKEGGALTQNTDTGTIAVAGGTGGELKAEVNPYGYIMCLAVPSQCDVKIDYRGNPNGRITKNTFLEFYDQYCQNYEESTSKYKLNNVEELTVGGETISEENIKTLKYINTGKGTVADCVLTAVTSQFAPGEQPIVLNANSGNYSSRIGDVNEDGVFTLESDGTITYTYEEAEEGYFNKIKINKHGYVIECDDSVDNFSLTFNSDPVDTIKTITAGSFENAVEGYKGAFNESTNEYDEEEMYFVVNNVELYDFAMDYEYDEIEGIRKCNVDYIDEGEGLKKRIEIDANSLTGDELSEILRNGDYAKDIDDGTIYYSNPEALKGEISELAIDSDGYVTKFAKKEEIAYSVSFTSKSHQKTTITLNKEKITLTPKGTYQLEATVTPEEKSDYVEWTYDNPNITVDKGLVTVSENAALGEKGTIIAYISQDIQATCEVTVGTFGKDAFFDKYEEYCNKFNSDSRKYNKENVAITDLKGDPCAIDSLEYDENTKRHCTVNFNDPNLGTLNIDPNSYNLVVDEIIRDENCKYTFDDNGDISASNPDYALSYNIKFNSNGYLLKYEVGQYGFSNIEYIGEPEEEGTTINLNYEEPSEESPTGYLYANNINLKADSIYVLQADLKAEEEINPIFNIYDENGEKISWSEIIKESTLEATLDGEIINCSIDENDYTNLLVGPLPRDSGTLKIKLKIGKVSIANCSIKTLAN